MERKHPRVVFVKHTDLAKDVDVVTQPIEHVGNPACNVGEFEESICVTGSNDLYPL